MPRLCRWLEELQMKVHKLSEPTDWAVDMGSGSQDCMHVFFSALLNDGDHILLDAPSYPGTMGALAEFGVNYVEVPSDSEGMVAKDLDRILAEWPADRRKPKLIYTIPTGSNPAGTCASEQRKKDLLNVSKKYNVLLCEDDAYFYLVSLAPGISAISAFHTHGSFGIVLWPSTTTSQYVGYGEGSYRRDRSCSPI